MADIHAIFTARPNLMVRALNESPITVLSDLSTLPKRTSLPSARGDGETVNLSDTTASQLLSIVKVWLIAIWWSFRITVETPVQELTPTN